MKFKLSGMVTLFCAALLITGCGDAKKEKEKKAEGTEQSVTVSLPDRFQKMIPDDAEIVAAVDAESVAKNPAFIEILNKDLKINLDAASFKTVKIYIFASIVKEYCGLYVQSKDGQAEKILNSIFKTGPMKRKIQKEATENGVRTASFRGGLMKSFDNNSCLILIGKSDFSENSGNNNSDLLRQLDNHIVSACMDVTKIKSSKIFRNITGNVPMLRSLNSAKVNVIAHDGETELEGVFANAESAEEFVSFLKKSIKGDAPNVPDYIRDMKISVNGNRVSINVNIFKMLEETLKTARIRSQEFASMSNMKMLGLHIFMYKDSYNNRTPDDLNKLVEKGFVTDPKMFIAPFDTLSTPFSKGGSLRPYNTTYAYLGKGLNTSMGELPILIEKPWLLPKGATKVNILFMDGSVRTEFGIKGLNTMTCRQLVSIICDKHYVPAKEKEILLKNAETIDTITY